MQVFYATEDRPNIGKPDFRFRLYKDVPELKDKPVSEDIYIGPESAIHPADLARAKGLPVIEPTPVRPEQITDAPPVTPVASVSAEIAESSAEDADSPEPFDEDTATPSPETPGELTPAQKAAATRAAKKAKAESAAVKRAAKQNAKKAK